MVVLGGFQCVPKDRFSTSLMDSTLVTRHTLEGLSLNLADLWRCRSGVQISLIFS